MIRFEIAQPDQPLFFTEWIEEPMRHGGTLTAVTEMAQMRQQYPNAAIRIERTTVIPKPDLNQVRFKVVLPNNETRYSKVVAETEAEALLAQLHERFPQAKEISRG